MIILKLGLTAIGIFIGVLVIKAFIDYAVKKIGEEIKKNNEELAREIAYRTDKMLTMRHQREKEKNQDQP